MKKKILLALVAILIIIQFIRPARNESETASPNAIATRYTVPDSVESIMKKACDDCHSNHTVYPWYTNVQPVGWWMQHHVNDGKRELNFDEFASYTPKRQHHKLGSIIKQIKEDEMPLDSYTWIHKNAILSDAEKQTLMHWSQGLMDQIAAQYNLPPEPERRRERD